MGNTASSRHLPRLRSTEHRRRDAVACRLVDGIVRAERIIDPVLNRIHRPESLRTVSLIVLVAPLGTSFENDVWVSSDVDLNGENDSGLRDHRRRSRRGSRRRAPDRRTVIASRGFELRLHCATRNEYLRLHDGMWRHRVNLIVAWFPPWVRNGVEQLDGSAHPWRRFPTTAFSGRASPR